MREGLPDQNLIILDGMYLPLDEGYLDLFGAPFFVL